MTKLVTDKNNPELTEGQKNSVGQHRVYLVLDEEERAKGFIRPVRQTYIHVGKKIERDEEGRLAGRLLKMDEPEYKEYTDEYYTKENGYAGFIKYPKNQSNPIIGKYITQEELDAIVSRKTHFGGCGTSTRMGLALSETYSRDPKFYGATFCVACNRHLPVEEFVWEDGEVVGS